MNKQEGTCIIKQTFLLHAELETFLESAVLALITMMLIDRTAVVASTRICQVATHRSLEETLASLACQYTVMLTGALVATYNTLLADTDAILGTRLDHRI